MVSDRIAALLPARCKVGRYIALARAEESFAAFREEVLKCALEALHNPLRLLGSQHLYNAVGTRIPRMSPETKPLIEGFVQELLIAGELRRLVTVSRAHSAYQVILSPEIESDVVNGLTSITNALLEEGSLTIAQASNVISKRLRAIEQNVEILLARLLRDGVATRADQPGSRIDLIKVPHADS